MLAELLFRPFEALLNRGIERSTEAQAIARALDGRVLALTVDGTPFDLRLRIASERAAVTLPEGAAPDASIGGGPLSLGRLLHGDPQAPVRSGMVRMTGDTEIAERFRDLLRAAIPDFEGALSHLVGDPIAHEVGNAARAFTGWGEAAAQDLARGMSEQLQEHSRLLPTRREAREFAEAVDRLVNDVARAETRIRRLEESPRERRSS